MDIEITQEWIDELVAKHEKFAIAAGLFGNAGKSDVYMPSAESIQKIYEVLSKNKKSFYSYNNKDYSSIDYENIHFSFMK